MQLWDRFTDSARQAVLLAHGAARQREDNRMIGVTDLFLGILKQDEGRAVEILQALGVDIEALAADVGTSAGEVGLVCAEGEIGFTPSAQGVISLAYTDARRLGDVHIGAEHLLLGMLRQDKGGACEALRARGVDAEKVRRQMED